MLEIFNLKPEAFGVDISNSSLKIAKLKKKRGNFYLASFSQRKIPPGIVKGGEIKKEKALIKIFKEAVSKVQGEKIKTKYLFASLPEEKSFLTVIQLPRLSEKDLQSAVIFEAENYIPLPIEEVYLDFQVVPPIVDHLSHLDVLISALPKKIVDSYFSFFQRAGFFPLAFENESLAISRALIEKGLTHSPVLLIDLGENRTNLIVYSGYSLRFSTSLAISSQHFTEILAKNFKISFSQAEKLKMKYGLGKRLKIEFEHGKVLKEEKSEIFEALIPPLVDLSQQIKRYLDYYQSHASHEHLLPNGRGVSRVLLSGGGANLKGLDQFLSQSLKLPVELGNPWVNIKPKEERGKIVLSLAESLSFTTALGLAQREFYD